MHSNQSSGKKIDELNNGLLLELMFQDTPPSIDQVINARNELWRRGAEPSMPLFFNLVELAVHHEHKCREEWNAYGAVAKFIGATVVAGPSAPDLLLGGRIPVEVKIGVFNVAALRQLQRYMKVYGSSEGIAVGRALAVELPAGVTFLEVRFDDMSMEYIIQEAAE
jgi:hypothetical protein